MRPISEHPGVFGFFFFAAWLFGKTLGPCRDQPGHASLLAGFCQDMPLTPAAIRRDPPWGTAIFAKRVKFAVPHRGAGVA